MKNKKSYKKRYDFGGLVGDVGKGLLQGVTLGMYKPKEWDTDFGLKFMQHLANFQNQMQSKAVGPILQGMMPQSNMPNVDPSMLTSAMGGTAMASGATAAGTAAIGAGTSMATAGAAALSDKRAKANIKPIGMTFDGQPIYKYNYKGSPKTEIGLMAQDVEKVNKNAVGNYKGLKTVNYDLATKNAELYQGGGWVNTGKNKKMWYAEGHYFTDPQQYVRWKHKTGEYKVEDEENLFGEIMSTPQKMANYLTGGKYEKPSGTVENVVRNFPGYNGISTEGKILTDAVLDPLNAVLGFKGEYINLSKKWDEIGTINKLAKTVNVANGADLAQDLDRNYSSNPSYGTRKGKYQGGDYVTSSVDKTATKINPEKINWFSTLDPRKWGLNDYSKFQGSVEDKITPYESAFGRATKEGEKNFVWKGKRYSTKTELKPEILNNQQDVSFNSKFKQARDNGQQQFKWRGKTFSTKLVSEEMSNNYWNSKEFLQDYYTELFPNLDINKLAPQDSEDVRYYYEYLSPEHQKRLDSIRKIEDSWGYKWQKAPLNFDNLLEEHYQIKDLKDPLSQRNLQDLYLKKQEEKAKQALENLSEPVYFSITNQKGNLKSDGYQGQGKLFISIPNEKDGFTMPVHELTHKADRNYRKELLSTDEQIRFMKSIFASKGERDWAAYLSDPSEINSRHLSTRYWLNKNYPGYKLQDNLNNSHIDYLMKNRDKLPYDINQLIDIYGGDPKTMLDQFRRFQQGGQVQTEDMIPYDPNHLDEVSENLVQFDGPSHDFGGIKTPAGEFDKQETVLKPGIVGNKDPFAFSDNLILSKEIVKELGLPNRFSNKTIAQASKLIENKYESNYKDLSVTKNTKDIMKQSLYSKLMMANKLENLKNRQENGIQSKEDLTFSELNKFQSGGPLTDSSRGALSISPEQAIAIAKQRGFGQLSVEQQIRAGNNIYANELAAEQRSINPTQMRDKAKSSQRQLPEIEMQNESNPFSKLDVYSENNTVEVDPTLFSPKNDSMPSFIPPQKKVSYQTVQRGDLDKTAEAFLQVKQNPKLFQQTINKLQLSGNEVSELKQMLGAENINMPQPVYKKTVDNKYKSVTKSNPVKHNAEKKKYIDDELLTQEQTKYRNKIISKNALIEYEKDPKAYEDNNREFFPSKYPPKKNKDKITGVIPPDVAMNLPYYKKQNEGKPFTVLSKTTNRMYKYNKEHELIAEIDAIRGTGKGDFPNTVNPEIDDNPNKATTRAGEYIMKDDYYYDNMGGLPTTALYTKEGKILDDGIGIHPTWDVDKRDKYYYNNNIDDNLQSHGCINCNKEEWQKYISRKNNKGEEMFYITKEPKIISKEKQSKITPSRKGYEFKLGGEVNKYQGGEEVELPWNSNTFKLSLTPPSVPLRKPKIGELPEDYLDFTDSDTDYPNPSYGAKRIQKAGVPTAYQDPVNPNLSWRTPNNVDLPRVTANTTARNLEEYADSTQSNTNNINFSNFSGKDKKDFLSQLSTLDKAGFISSGLGMLGQAATMMKKETVPTNYNPYKHRIDNMLSSRLNSSYQPMYNRLNAEANSALDRDSSRSINVQRGLNNNTYATKMQILSELGLVENGQKNKMVLENANILNNLGAQDVQTRNIQEDLQARTTGARRQGLRGLMANSSEQFSNTVFSQSFANKTAQDMLKWMATIAPDFKIDANTLSEMNELVNDPDAAPIVALFKSGYTGEDSKEILVKQLEELNNKRAAKGEKPININLAAVALDQKLQTDNKSK